MFCIWEEKGFTNKFLETSFHMVKKHLKCHFVEGKKKPSSWSKTLKCGKVCVCRRVRGRGGGGGGERENLQMDQW